MHYTAYYVNNPSLSGMLGVTALKESDKWRSHGVAVAIGCQGNRRLLSRQQHTNSPTMQHAEKGLEKKRIFFFSRRVKVNR